VRAGIAPIPLVPVEEMGSDGGNRINRILGRQVHGEHISAIAARWNDSHDRQWTARYIDASREKPVITSGGTTAIHILWTDGSKPHLIRAGKDEAEVLGLAPWVVAPGDTVTIPRGAPYRIGAGIIAFSLEMSDRRPTSETDLRILPPTHGLSVFRRFNRRTICSATPALVLERWKLTHPLELPLNTTRWHYLTNLVTPVALGWPGGTELVGRTDSRLLPQGLAAITLVPGDLGYVLMGCVPNLEMDVIAPLRGAGYDADAIAALGVPRELLAGR
jgi:hypothetical protein